MGDVILLSATRASRAEDLPTLHERIATTLYGPAYRQLFLGERSVPVWIKAYNSTSKGVETPGLRVYFLKVRFSNDTKFATRPVAIAITWLSCSLQEAATPGLSLFPAMNESSSAILRMAEPSLGEALARRNIRL